MKLTFPRVNAKRKKRYITHEETPIFSYFFRSEINTL